MIFVLEKNEKVMLHLNGMFWKRKTYHCHELTTLKTKWKLLKVNKFLGVWYYFFFILRCSFRHACIKLITEILLFRWRREFDPVFFHRELLHVDEVKKRGLNVNWKKYSIKKIVYNVSFHMLYHINFWRWPYTHFPRRKYLSNTSLRKHFRF